MIDDLSPSRIVALFPFAVAASPITARQTDLCRGLAFFLERRLNRIPGVLPLLQHLFIAPEGDPKRKGWLMTSTLWTVDQALALPFPPEMQPTHLLQGRAEWTEERLDVEMELIDMRERESVARDRVEVDHPTTLDPFFNLLGAMTDAMLESESVARLTARVPTKSLAAFEDFLVGLAAYQAWMQGMVPAENPLRNLVSAIEKDGDFAEACEALEDVAARCFDAGDEETRLALAALEKARAACPAYARFSGLLGLAQAHRGEEATAEPLLESYLRAEPAGALAPRALLQLAHFQRKRKDVFRARQMLQNAVFLAPDDAAAWEALADCYEVQGEAAQASECWKRALQEDPDRPGSLHKYGASLLRRGETIKALPILQKAWELTLEAGAQSVAPDLLRALRHLRLLFEADEVATRWAEEVETSQEAWVALGWVRFELGQRPAVEHCLAKARALAVGARQEAAADLLAWAHDYPLNYREYERVARLGNLTPLLAEAAARRLEALQPRDVLTVHEQLVVLYTLSEQWGKAAESQEYVAAKLNESAAYVKLAELHHECGAPEAERGALAKAVELDTTNATARARLVELDVALSLARKRAEAQAAVEVVKEEPPAGGLRRLLGWLKGLKGS